MEIRVVKVERPWGPVFVVVQVLPVNERRIIGAFIRTTEGFSFIEVGSLSQETRARAFAGLDA